MANGVRWNTLGLVTSMASSRNWKRLLIGFTGPDEPARMITSSKFWLISSLSSEMLITTR